MLKRTPKFADYSAQYLAYFDSVKDAKRPATIQKERGVIKLWTEHMGGLQLDKIRRLHINSFIEKRQAQKISCRTVNLDIIALPASRLPKRQIQSPRGFARRRGSATLRGPA